ncbi:ankyrin, putative [Plasmodium berghei]|uniref:Ankyrin-repeat protein, putative n=2 Tax=Plasmodium berghei TaxID=5821 RepID=A0A509AKX1_PLABA|nr:ankyrin-repeat protein, putative [Plasmodium berghei ANKA]CXI52726.1 ankyrin, putative [Plasmodium berghei]SCL94683.1 ankyrin, putative [Plasmodium berghei]SCM16078.1 ankyrin, putative [Plasmodium berghei]SCM17873.1 ankyrin, putative [Plasmodium berghei]SCN26187.1 ankyrin, putative [Plasmodium berghei]|eukprot:XP_034422002.1 ankyrin-repeat protein, putative [Plasmodium berghei ANKA]
MLINKSGMNTMGEQNYMIHKFFKKNETNHKEENDLQWFHKKNYKQNTIENKKNIKNKKQTPKNRIKYITYTNNESICNFYSWPCHFVYFRNQTHTQTKCTKNKHIKNDETKMKYHLVRFSSLTNVNKSTSQMLYDMNMIEKNISKGDSTKELYVPHIYSDEKKRKGILKIEKWNKKEKKKVRINICCDNNSDKIGECFISVSKQEVSYPQIKNGDNCSLPQINCKSYNKNKSIINICENDEIRRIISNSSYGDSFTYSDLDAYMGEYMDNIENVSSIAPFDLESIHLASNDGNIELIKYLLKSGIDINSKTKIRKYTALHICASKGDIKTVKFLVNNNADINALTYNNETALWFASISNHLNVCKYLLQNGALSYLNKKGDSALHAASTMGNYEVVKLLIDNSANITHLDVNLLEPIHYASFEGHKGIVKILMYKQIEQTLKETMDKIIYNMKIYNVYTKNLETYYYFKYKSIIKKKVMSKILCCVITSGSYKLVKYILKKGANVNYFDIHLQLFPIHAAAVSGNIKIFKALIHKGANLFVKTPCNNLPINLVEDVELRQYILQQSRKINLRNAWIIRNKKSDHIFSHLSYDIFYHICLFF